MTINELYIQLDLQHENRIDILEDVAIKCNKGYIFVDSSDGHCYLFDKNGNEDDIKKLTTIDNELFYDSNIESIVIPDSIKNIKNWAFAYCRSLKSIVIPNSIESIGDYAFNYCKSLKSVIIPDLVKNIGHYAFCNCKSLKSVIIPDLVKNIGHYAFCNCKSLKSIVIPDSVESIRNCAFGNCEKLKSLIFKGKTIYQIKAMENYPFGIEDESIIRCIDFAKSRHF